MGRKVHLPPIREDSKNFEVDNPVKQADTHVIAVKPNSGAASLSPLSPNGVVNNSGARDEEAHNLLLNG